MTKSKRYWQQMKKLGPEGRKVKRKYESFNIEPGMSTWIDMPQEYKNQFKIYQQAREELATDEILKHERTRQINYRVKERIDAMEKRLFGLKSDGAGGQKPKRKKSSGNADATICNFIDRRFFEKRKAEIRKDLVIKKDRPPILLMADVCGWAWWNKSQYLEAYLADDYDIKVISLIGPESSGVNARRFRLYVTYGYSYVLRLQNVPKERRVTGVTAHRPLNLLKGSMSFADNVHANSKMLLHDLKQIVANHDKVHYVPNGVDEKIFSEVNPIRKTGELVAGHVGKKCAAKHQEDIILPALNASGVKSVTNLSDYTNKKPYCEMPEMYNEMDVFIVASEEDGTPNPALEAAACGRPIISNRIGNMPEFIKDGYNGFIVGLKIDEYIEKLEYLRNNRDHLIEMGKNARKTVEENWTWKIQAENYREMFKKCLR